MNLRDLAEKDLHHTLEGIGSMSVSLLSPNGVWYRDLKGQVLYDTVRLDPETAERTVTPCPIVTLRRSSLTRIPLAGENWMVEIPVSPVAGAAIGQYVFSPTRPPEGGSSIGFIRLYLQAVEQVPTP